MLRKISKVEIEFRFKDARLLDAKTQDSRFHTINADRV